MKNLQPNLTFESLNDLLNGLKELLPIKIRYKLILLFEKKFPHLKAVEPDNWTPDIFKNQNSIIEELLTQLMMDNEVDSISPFTFRNQYFLTFTDEINERSTKQLKHLIHFDRYNANGKSATKNNNR